MRSCVACQVPLCHSHLLILLRRQPWTSSDIKPHVSPRQPHGNSCAPVFPLHCPTCSSSPAMEGAKVYVQDARRLSIQRLTCYVPILHVLSHFPYMAQGILAAGHRPSSSGRRTLQGGLNLPCPAESFNPGQTWSFLRACERWRCKAGKRRSPRQARQERPDPDTLGPRTGIPAVGGLLEAAGHDFVPTMMLMMCGRMLMVVVMLLLKVRKDTS